MRSAIVACAFLLALAPAAWAQDAQDPEVAAIWAAFDAGQFGEAHRLAEALVAKRGDDVTARYLAASMALRVVRIDEAMAHVAAGLRASPDQVDLLGLRAGLRFAEDDEIGARADAIRALELVDADPEAAPDAALVFDQLEITDRARARLAGLDPGLAVGSPEAFVDRACAMVAAGNDAEVARLVSLELASGLPDPPRDRSALVDRLREVIADGRRGADERDQRFLGWVVDDAVPAGDDRWRVAVRVPMVRSYSMKNRQLFAAALADPAAHAVFPADLRQLLLAVPPSDRPALLERLLGRRNRRVATVDFEVARAGGDYEITDVRYDGVSVKEQLPVAEKLVASVDSKPKVPLARQLVLLLGAVTVAAAVLSLAVYFVRRRASGRRGPGRGSRRW